MNEKERQVRSVVCFGNALIRYSTHDEQIDSEDCMISNMYEGV